MLKNKEVKRLIFIELITVLVFITLTVIVNYQNYRSYNDIIINNNAYIANYLIEKHPELESDIIDAVIKSLDKSNTNLEKYGLDKIEIYQQFPEIMKIRNDMIRDNFILLVMLFIFMFILVMIFIVNQYRKIRGINKYLYKVLNDNYTLNIREYEEGDISNLKNDIYKVTMKLKNMNEISLADNKYLESVLSDISHQIKTPLTSMYVINDLLMNDEMDNKIRKDFLNKNRLQLERMEWLVTSLLKMSRLDSGSVVLNKNKVNVLALINTSLEPLQIPIELKEIELVIDIPSDIEFIGDFKWSSEALINIIKNAYEHTPQGGQIVITGASNPLYTSITITDNGEGIDKKDLPLIFKRFYKGNSNKESIGIGLNMAKMVIEKQNGTIEVDSIKGKYTTFMIKLYKKDI